MRMSVTALPETVKNANPKSLTTWQVYFVKQSTMDAPTKRVS